MSDFSELDIDRLPAFRILFTLLAAHADTIVAVYEHDAGGEITELRKISTTPYFDKSYALPRDDREEAPVSYSWLHLNEFRFSNFTGGALRGVLPTISVIS